MRQLVWLLFLISTLSIAQTTDRIISESTSNSQSNSTSTSINETTVKSPPPSATSPPITIISNDLCVVGVSGAVQTQILGISGGSTVRDLNCERLKLAKNLYDMGMKVAAVSTLCQDPRVFDAMMDAGTPCPIQGKIGEQARQLWQDNPNLQPKPLQATTNESFWKNFSFGLGTILLLILLL